MYYGPLRSETRHTLRNALKDYNTYGEVDENFFLQEKSRHTKYHGGER